MGRLLDKYKLVHTGDFLRQYAKENDLFIYPYDLLTGADIALYENTEAKEKRQRYYVCSLEELSMNKGKVGAYERPAKCEFPAALRHEAAVDFEGALTNWNKRMREGIVRFQRPFWSRFFSIELGNIVFNAGFLLIIYSVISAIPGLYSLLKEYALPFVFILLCSNIKNIFTKSYGEEIPRETLRDWAKIYGMHFQSEFYMTAMDGWREVQERHKTSLPVYLMKKRGLLQPKADCGEKLPELPQEIEGETEEVQGLVQENKVEETDYQAYCQEIIEKLDNQTKEIGERRAKISDRMLRLYVEKIFKILREIRFALDNGYSEPKVIAARKVVSYWNEETISLIDNYIMLLNNSSQEAEDTKEHIMSLLEDLAPVYRKELGRITATHTMEVKASMEVLQKEIDEALSRER